MNDPTNRNPAPEWLTTDYAALRRELERWIGPWSRLPAADVEDAVSDTVVTVLERAASDKHPNSRRYAAVMARNRVLTQLTTETRRAELRGLIAECLETIPECRPTPERIALAHSLLQYVQPRLSDVQRELLGYRIAETSSGETARELGLTYDQLRARVTEIRRRLAELRDEWTRGRD